MRFADMFAIAAANRAIQLALAIELNVRALLFFAAAPLLRVHLDGMLRLGYVVLSPDGEAVAREVYVNRTDFSKIPGHVEGGKLRDWALVKWVGQFVSWVPGLYESTNGYVHLSETIASHPFEPTDANGRTVLRFSEREHDWPEVDRVEMLRLADAVTRGVTELLRFQHTGTLFMHGDRRGDQFGIPERPAPE